MPSRFTYSRWDGTQVGLRPRRRRRLRRDHRRPAVPRRPERGAAPAAAVRASRTATASASRASARCSRSCAASAATSSSSYDLGGVYDDIAQELREVVEHGARGARRAGRARRAESGDARRQEITDEVAAASASCSSTCCRPTSPARCEDLQNYDFTSTEAQRAVRGADGQAAPAADAAATSTRWPGAMQQHVARGHAAHEGHARRAQPHARAARSAGEEPDFEEFMERYGDFFPENPQTLDELLEVMAQRMAAMQAMLNSMTPEQRAQLQGLSEQLIEDMDLRWQVDQLGAEPAQAVPADGLGPALRLLAARTRSASAEAAELMERARRPRPAREPAARRHRARARWPRSTSTGPASCSATTPPRASSAWPSWPRCSRRPASSSSKEGRYELTPRGIRSIGQNALSDLFTKLAKDTMGRHELDRTGVGHERELRDQALRVRRPVQPPHRAHGAQRRQPRRAGHAGAAHARRLRGRAHRAARALVARC